MFELFYTSAPRGLKSGSSGFTTVAQTAGLPSRLQSFLESISSYREAPGIPANSSPDNYMFLRWTLGKQPYFILSRIAFSGKDYTNRNNKLAHHVVLNSDELGNSTPAKLLANPSCLVSEWDQVVGELAPRKISTNSPPNIGTGPCDYWGSLTGDAGWAGVVAGQIKASSNKPVYLLTPYGTDTTRVLLELNNLLGDSNWDSTFCTYYYKQLPGNLDCRIRFIYPGMAETDLLTRDKRNQVFQLGPQNAPIPSGQLVEIARGAIALPQAVKPTAHHRPQIPTQPDIRLAAGKSPSLDTLSPSRRSTRKKEKQPAIIDEQQVEDFQLLPENTQAAGDALPGRATKPITVPDLSSSTSLSTKWILISAAAVGCLVLAMGILVVAISSIFPVRQNADKSQGSQNEQETRGNRTAQQLKNNKSDMDQFLTDRTGETGQTGETGHSGLQDGEGDPFNPSSTPGDSENLGDSETPGTFDSPFGDDNKPNKTKNTNDAVAEQPDKGKVDLVSPIKTFPKYTGKLPDTAKEYLSTPIIIDLPNFRMPASGEANHLSAEIMIPDELVKQNTSLAWIADTKKPNLPVLARWKLQVNGNVEDCFLMIKVDETRSLSATIKTTAFPISEQVHSLFSFSKFQFQNTVTSETLAQIEFSPKDSLTYRGNLENIALVNQRGSVSFPDIFPRGTIERIEFRFLNTTLDLDEPGTIEFTFEKDSDGKLSAARTLALKKHKNISTRISTTVASDSGENKLVLKFELLAGSRVVDRATISREIADLEKQSLPDIDQDALRLATLKQKRKLEEILDSLKGRIEVGYRIVAKLDEKNTTLFQSSEFEKEFR